MQARVDLQKYGDNAIVLYALQLKFDLEDLDAVAAQSLTDGPDDKKCDPVYVDKGRRTAIVAQGYMAKTIKPEAPANKAADLNTAVAWLITRKEGDLPIIIRSAARELREAIDSGAIESVEFWYVHNCRESKNVRNELESVRNTAIDAIRSFSPRGKNVAVSALEIGDGAIEKLYKATRAPILIAESLTIPSPGGYTTAGKTWKAYSTSVPVAWLRRIYTTYGNDLFSANVRGYLGSRKSDSNINHGIKQSVTDRPGDFWAFNNGVTALVNDFTVRGKSIIIDGLSIVNGAQTTGAIGTMDKAIHDRASIAIRFIASSDQKLVHDIVLYNNSQNRIAPADFRSNDPVQERLRSEFGTHFPDLTYRGGRRGGAEAMTRPRNLLPSDTVAQALAAFHGRPGLAYHRKSDIWESDEQYARIFNDQVSAPHIVFVFSLYQAIAEFRRDLTNREARDDLKLRERGELEFLRLRGSVYLLMAAIAHSMETFLDRRVHSAFELRFEDVRELPKATVLWKPLVRAALPFQEQLRGPIDKGLENIEEVGKALDLHATFITSVRTALESQLDDFASEVQDGIWQPKPPKRKIGRP